MLTVLITYRDGSTDLKDCWDVDELCLDGVESIEVIRDERKTA